MPFTVASGFDVPLPTQPHVVQISTAERRQSMMSANGEHMLLCVKLNLQTERKKEVVHDG